MKHTIGFPPSSLEPQAGGSSPPCVSESTGCQGGFKFPQKTNKCVLKSEKAMGAVRGVLILDLALGKRLQKCSHLQGMSISAENKVSLSHCAGTGYGEAVKQTAQQAIQLGSDTAKEKREKDPFLYQTASRLHCHELGWQLGMGWPSSSQPSGAPAGLGKLQPGVNPSGR